MPLAVVGCGIAATILLGLLALGLTESLAFGARQTVMVGIWVAGLSLTAGAYAVACVRALRRVKAWERMARTGEAAAALWALALTAIVVISPVLLALFLPTPAP